MGSHERLSTRRGRHWLFASLVVVIVARTPFLFLGYGADEDPWRVAEAARDVQETGHYHVSRFPGYPLIELLSAPLVALAGPVSTNAATIVVALACVTAWHLLIQRHLQHPGGLTFLFAAMPLFWLSSAATTEHTWLLLFQILTLVGALQRENFGAADLCARVVLGFRPSDAAGVLPLLTLFFLRREFLSRWASFTVPVLVTVALAFLPVLPTYGVLGWIAGTVEQGTRTAAGQSLALPALAYRSVYSIGPLAVLCLAVAAGTEWQRVSAALRRGDELTTVAVLGLFSVIIAFALFPFERAYLLPGLPYLLILLPVLNRTELEGARADGFAVIGLARNQAHVERVAGYGLDVEGVAVRRIP
jgi:hypothetical protein